MWKDVGPQPQLNLLGLKTPPVIEEGEIKLVEKRYGKRIDLPMRI